VPARPAAVSDGQKLSAGQHNVATFHPFVHKVARYAVHTQTPLLSTRTEHPDRTVYRSAVAPAASRISLTRLNTTLIIPYVRTATVE